MEVESLIKSISEFGILIVIAAVYLIQNFRDNSSLKKDIAELKALISKLTNDSLEANHNTLHAYELQEYMGMFTKAMKCDLVTEALIVISNNNIHADEEAVKRNFKLKTKVILDKNTDFLEGKTCDGHSLLDIAKTLNLDELSDVCITYIFTEQKDRKVINLVRQLDTLLGAFKAQL